MPLLEVTDLHAHYDFAEVLQGISFRVGAGEIVSIFGRNGAGKTTALRTIIGWLKSSPGSIKFEGEEIGGLSPDSIFRRGIGFIPEDRRILATLTVEENLTLGLFCKWQSRAERRRQMDRVISLFPRLGERRRQMGKTLSGGEQQMLAIGRALIANPKLLLVDEPTEGLAPIVVNEIFSALTLLRDEGVAMLLVEQNVRRAGAISSFCCVMQKGRIVNEGRAADMLADETVRQKLAI
jgi:branched-chain amino acid transport system ATP-binding protein